jgi:hypothetical protein
VGAPKEYSKEISKNGASMTRPGLQNFYMVGQWASGMVGLNTMGLTGRNFILDLSKKDGRKLKTNTT